MWMKFSKKKYKLAAVHQPNLLQFPQSMSDCVHSRFVLQSIKHIYFQTKMVNYRLIT